MKTVFPWETEAAYEKSAATQPLNYLTLHSSLRAQGAPKTMLHLSNVNYMTN